MTHSPRIRVWLVALASLVGMVSSAEAAESPVGTYVKTATKGKPEMTLTIEMWEPGKARLTYRVKGAEVKVTIDSALDGSDAPVMVDGKASGETMAITRVDKYHATTVLKMNGKTFGTSKGTFSNDFTTLTAESEFSASYGGNAAGKSTEVWTRK